MELKYFSFQAWKVMEFNCWLWKGMENYSVCGTEIIVGVDQQGQNKIQASYVRRYPKTRTIFKGGSETLGHGKLEKVMEKIMESHGI